MASFLNPAADRRHSGAIPDLELTTLIGNSRAAACGALVSRITGFGRMAAAASVLGPTFFGNLFMTIAILPSAMYLILIGRLISAVLVPPLVRRMNERGRDEVQRFAAAVLGLTLAALVGICLLTALAAPLLLRVLTGAVADPQTRQDQVRLGVPLLLMLIPQTVLYGIAGTGMAVQQAQGRFALPAFAPALENLLNIGVLVTSALLFGSGTSLAQTSQPQVLLLGLGTTAAVSAHAAVQWIGAYRVGIRLLPRLSWPDAEIREIIRQGGLSIAFVALDYVAYLLLLVIAGTIPGGVAALQITKSLYNLPVALFAMPLANAQLPLLATCHQRQEMHGFGATYKSALRLVIFILVPAALVFTVLPYAIASATAFGAMDKPHSIALIAACLAGQGIGLIGDGAFVLSTTASYVRRDPTTPLRAAVVRTAIIGAGAGIIYTSVDSANIMMWAIGMSVTVGDVTAAIFLHRRLRSALPAAALGKAGLMSAVAASALAVVPAVLLNREFPYDAGLASYERVCLALFLTSVTMGVYLAIQYFRGSHELRLLVRLPGRRAVNP